MAPTVVWRRPYGTGEDRNPPSSGGDLRNAGGGAGPTGPARIATPGPPTPARARGWWRRPYGTGEDRNCHHQMPPVVISPSGAGPAGPARIACRAVDSGAGPAGWRGPQWLRLSGVRSGFVGGGGYRAA